MPSSTPAMLRCTAGGAGDPINTCAAAAVPPTPTITAAIARPTDRR